MPITKCYIKNEINCKLYQWIKSGVTSITRKCLQETKIVGKKDNQRKISICGESLPTARCLCGFEILVVPDLKAMNRAIKMHLAKHKKTYDGAEEKLTQQVLIVASTMKT